MRFQVVLLGVVVGGCGLLLTPVTAAADQYTDFGIIYDDWVQEDIYPPFGKLFDTLPEGENHLHVSETGHATNYIKLKNTLSGRLEILPEARLLRLFPEPPHRWQGFLDIEPKTTHMLDSQATGEYQDSWTESDLHNPNNPLTFYAGDNTGCLTTFLHTTHRFRPEGSSTWPWGHSCIFKSGGSDPHTPVTEGYTNIHFHDWFVNIPTE